MIDALAPRGAVLDGLRCEARKANANAREARLEMWRAAMRVADDIAGRYKGGATFDDKCAEYLRLVEANHQAWEAARSADEVYRTMRRSLSDTTGARGHVRSGAAFARYVTVNA